MRCPMGVKEYTYTSSSPNPTSVTNACIQDKCAWWLQTGKESIPPGGRIRLLGDCAIKALAMKLMSDEVK